MEQILEIDEFILLQNPIVGSHLIYQFTKEYYSVKQYFGKFLPKD